jgi:electron transfer flavoprotein alpha subunit
MKAGIVVIAEIGAEGLTTASREVISFARRLAESAGESLLVVVPGHFPDMNQPPCGGAGATKPENPPFRSEGAEGFSYEDTEEMAAAADCDVTVLTGEHLSAYSAEAWIAALSTVCGEIDPRFICIPHTSRGWDYGPGLAIRLEGALIGAVEGFRLDGGNILFKRSFLKGQWQMEVLPEQRPTVLTILPEAKRGEGGAAPAPTGPACDKSTPPRVSFVTARAKALRTKPLGSLRAPETAYDFSEAEVIVSAGKGIGAAENIGLIKRLAGIFPKSAVGCSRSVCDLGWMEHRRQIGMTGRTVTPALYIACGISGAMPHLAGMRNSRSIVAINRDQDAAIFQVAHLGVVEDLLTFIPAVLELLENRKKESSND